MIVENPEETILNGDRVGDIEVDNSDESEPILPFKRTKPTMKPVELPHTHHIKSIISRKVPLTVPLPRLRTHSLGPPIILSLLYDTIENRGKNKQSTPKSAKTTPKTAQKPTAKPA